MIDTNEASDTSSLTPSDQFYAVQATDDDLIAMAAQLEKICEGLGTWFMDIDVEFQRDLMAAGYLFWKKKKGPCQCAHDGKAKAVRTDSRPPRPSPPANGKRPTLLQSFRESRGLSQHQLAKIVGVTQPSIWRWENGRLSHGARVSPHVQANIEALFGKSFTELLMVEP